MSTSAPSGTFFSLTSLGLPSSQSQFLQLWLLAMQAAFPGYNPSAANLEYVNAQVEASWAADLANLCTQGATELFRQYGTQLLNLPYQAGTPAQGVVSFTSADTGGHTLPIGTQLTLTLGGTQVAFQTATVLTIPPGYTNGQAVVIGLQSGSALNGAGSPAQLVSQVDWVTSVTVITSTAGGVDQEDDNQYLIRLANTLQLLAPRPITASDYATLAINFTPLGGTDQQEVGRATAIDGYDPLTTDDGYQPLGSGTGTYNNEREVTVCVTDVNGNALDSDTMTAVGEYLAALREINFIVNVIPPAYSLIYVAVTVVAQAGFSAATVQANVQTALLNYLTPANFGLPQGAITGWNNTTSVYLSRIEAIVQGCNGVDHIPAGTLAIDVNANPTNTTADLVLTGPFPLAISSLVSIPLSAITVL